MENEINWKNDELNGNFKTLYETGEIKFVEKYRNGIIVDGKYVYYFKDGKVDEEVEYRDGKEDGKRTYYNGDGTIKKEEEYKDGQLIEK